MSSNRRNRLSRPTVWLASVVIALAIGVFVSPALQRFRNSLFLSGPVKMKSLSRRLHSNSPRLRCGICSIRRASSVSCWTPGRRSGRRSARRAMSGSSRGSSTGTINFAPSRSSLATQALPPTFKPVYGDPVTMQSQTRDGTDPDPAPMLIYQHESFRRPLTS